MREQATLTPATGPLRATLHFTYKRPKSHLRTGGELRKGAPRDHVSRPDVDNLAKFVMDALGGACYTDDCQIVHLDVRKTYGDVDAVQVTLETV